MSEKRSISVDKMNNGWVVWLVQEQPVANNPRLCFCKEELFFCIREFFEVSELLHVNESVSQIYEYEGGFLIEDDTWKRPSIFVEL